MYSIFEKILASKFLPILIMFLVAIGFIAPMSKPLSVLIQAMILILGMFYVNKTKDANNLAAFYAIAIIGLEIGFKTAITALSNEFGKYGAIVLLTQGLFYNNKLSKVNKGAVIFLFFLCFSVPYVFIFDLAHFGSEWRKAIGFNMSGPVLIGISSMYFSASVFTTSQFKNLILILGVTIFCYFGVVINKVPDFSAIEFTSESSVEGAGGYAPNQASVGCGVALFCLCLLKILDFKLTRFAFLDIILLIIPLVLGIITFSRGGVITCVVSLVVVTLGLPFVLGFSRKLVLLLRSIALGVILFSSAAVLLDNLTGSLLSARYMSSLNKKKGQQEKTSTFDLNGRDHVIKADLAVFSTSPLFGVGPGIASYTSRTLGLSGLPAHTEFSRVLSEHGIFGILGLIALLSQAIISIFKKRGVNIIICLGFLIIALLNQGHAAMRIAVMAIGFGLAFLTIEDPPEASTLERVEVT